MLESEQQKQIIKDTLDSLQLRLDLIVLKSPNIERSKNFYEKIGISFVQEKHQQGLLHYSSQNIQPTIEIYSSKHNLENHVCLFFVTVNLKEYTKMLEKNGISYKQLKDSIYLRDPNNNRIEVKNE